MVDIWVPKPILEPKDPIMNTSRVGGFVRMRVIKPGFKEPRVDTGWFPNMVLNGGLDRLGTTSLNNSITRCVVGTDSTPPNPSQTSLGAQVAGSGSTFASSTNGYGGTYDGAGGRYKWYRQFIQFSEGAAAGVLREIGFVEGTSSSANDNNLTSRALITDGSGNPTDVTVLSDEILQVTYEIRHYLDDSDGSIAFEMSGVPYTGIYRPGGEGLQAASQLYPGTSTNIALGGTSSTFGAAGANISGASGSSPGSGTLSAYSNGNYYRDVSYPFSLAQGNATGGLLMFGWNSNAPSPGYKFLFDTPIPKDNTKLMTLNIRTSWGRK